MFQGMSKEDLAAVLGQTRFDFAQKKAGATIVRAEDECTHLYFLLNGRMEVSAQAHDNGYIFTEEIDAPYILQPENLFGISPRYTRTFVAKATCSLLLLSKSEVLRLTDDFIPHKPKKQKGYLGDIAPPTSNTASPVLSQRIVYIPQAVNLCTSRCRN